MADDADWKDSPWLKDPEGEPAGDGADVVGATDTGTDAGDAADADAADSPDGEAQDNRGRWEKGVDWLEKQTNRLPPPVAKPFKHVFGFARRFRKTCGCLVVGCGCFTVGWLLLFCLILAFWLGGYGPGGEKSKVRHPQWVTPSQSANWVPPTAPGEEPSTCAPGETLKSKPGGGMWCRRSGQFFESPSSNPRP